MYRYQLWLVWCTKPHSSELKIGQWKARPFEGSVLASYEAKIAKICNFWTFWPVNQLMNHTHRGVWQRCTGPMNKMDTSWVHRIFSLHFKRHGATNIFFYWWINKSISMDTWKSFKDKKDCTWNSPSRNKRKGGSYSSFRNFLNNGPILTNKVPIESSWKMQKIREH